MALLGCAGSGATSLDEMGASGSRGSPGAGGAVASSGSGGSKASGGTGAGGAKAQPGGAGGGVGVGVGGAGGTGGSGTMAVGSGGMDGSTPSGSDGGNADAGVTPPVMYPMLDAAQIGNPTMISNAFTLAESPLWDPCGHQLLFTDVTASTIHTLSASGQIGVLASNTGNANGIAFDVDGSLILAQMGGSPGHIARRDKSGMITVLEPAGGPLLHTPDDVIVRSDGTIYFSDGDFYPIGSLLGFSALLPVYALKPGGTGWSTARS